MYAVDYCHGPALVHGMVHGALVHGVVNRTSSRIFHGGGANPPP